MKKLPVYCGLCQKRIGNWVIHIKSKEHLFRLELFAEECKKYKEEYGFEFLDVRVCTERVHKACQELMKKEKTVFV